MTKRQLIDEILTVNRSAKPEFLARFTDTDLDEYLQHLRNARAARLVGDAYRYARYFRAPTRRPAVKAAAVPVSGDLAATAVLDEPTPAAIAATAVADPSSLDAPVTVEERSSLMATEPIPPFPTEEEPAAETSTSAPARSSERETPEESDAVYQHAEPDCDSQEPAELDNEADEAKSPEQETLEPVAVSAESEAEPAGLRPQKSLPFAGKEETCLL